MLAFIVSPHSLSRSFTPPLPALTSSRRASSPCTRRPRTKRSTTTTPTTKTTTTTAAATMEAAPPSQAWRAAVDATIDDFIKSGMTIIIGHGAQPQLRPLLDALDAHSHVATMVDMAYMATTPATAALLRERSLPDDPAVNFNKSAPDLYIAAVDAVDAACNAVLRSPDIAAERAAAAAADRVVLIVPEDGLLSPHAPLPPVPVELTAFAPAFSIQRLRGDDHLRQLGVAAVDERTPGSFSFPSPLSSYSDGEEQQREEYEHISSTETNQTDPLASGSAAAAAASAQTTATSAPETAATTTTTATTVSRTIRDTALASPRPCVDVTLAANAPASVLEAELSRQACVVGVGILPASARTTVIVAASDGQPFDVTPAAAALAGLAAEQRAAALSPTRRSEALQTLQGWRFAAGHPDALEAQLVFRTPAAAGAFVRAVQRAAVECDYYGAAVRQGGAVVDVAVSTAGGDGITQADVMFATELSSTYACIMRAAIA